MEIKRVFETLFDQYYIPLVDYSSRDRS